MPSIACDWHFDGWLRARPASGRDPILVMTVALVGKVTGRDVSGTDPEPNRALADLPESSLDVLLGPAAGASVVGPASVEISGEKDLPPVQFGHDRENVGDLPHSEVTEDPEFAAGVDGLVLALDEGAIHRVSIPRGPMGVVDDVGMAEMKIGGEPHGHGRVRCVRRRNFLWQPAALGPGKDPRALAGSRQPAVRDGGLPEQV